VVGFDLSDTAALDLLWNEYNSRCLPPWNRENQSDVNDFERKVTEARVTPFGKPHGWLLDGDVSTSETDALALMLGSQFAQDYIERTKNKSIVDILNNGSLELDEGHPSPEFPLHCFPPRVREYIEIVSEVQIVNPAGVALSVLCVAGAAMGNAFRLRLKMGFEVPPVLWGAVISSSGTNKSGPFREIVKPLRTIVSSDNLEHLMRNPQGQLLIEDTTTEAVLSVLDGSPRGLIMANGEGAGWVGAFDRYNQGSKKKVSVDETIWLKMWDGDTYQKNRKTDSENTLIHNASCGVLIGIQPRKMAEVFDPTQFASGLVPRLLVVYLPKKCREWSEREMVEEESRWWADAILKLRSVPFVSQNPNTGEYHPNIITPSVEAKKQYVAEFNRIAQKMKDADEMSELFLGKAQGQTGRVALALHGLGSACGTHDILDELSEQTMLSGIEIMQYLLDQQLEVYNLAGGNYLKQRSAEVLAKAAASGGSISARTLQRMNQRKWPTMHIAMRDLEGLAKAGYGEWNASTKVFKVLKK